MDWYRIVKRHYDAGRYSVDDVQVFLNAGKITQEQYNEITNSAKE